MRGARVLQLLAWPRRRLPSWQVTTLCCAALPSRYTSRLLADAMVVDGVRYRTYQGAVEAVFGPRGGILLAIIQYPNLVSCGWMRCMVDGRRRVAIETRGSVRLQRSGVWRASGCRQGGGWVGG